MRLSLDQPDNVLVVSACDAARIVVGDRVLTSSFLLAAQSIDEDWRVDRASDVTISDLEPALALAPDIVLLGTGRQLVFPDHSLYGELLQRGIGLEVMDTLAACRTYNILVADGRPVVAALIIDRGASERA